MISCLIATELLSRQLDGPVPVRQRVALRWHLRQCDGCRTVQEQFRFLQQAMKNHPARPDGLRASEAADTPD